MNQNPLQSLSEYSRFLSQILNRPDVECSTVIVWSKSPYTGTAIIYTIEKVSKYLPNFKINYPSRNSIL